MFRFTHSPNEFQTWLLSQLQEEIVKVAQHISQERKNECVVEQLVDVAVPLVVLPIKEESVDAVQQPAPQGLTQERASPSRAWTFSGADRRAACTSTSWRDRRGGEVHPVASTTARGRANLGCNPQGPEETVEVVIVVPREREQQRTTEHAEGLRLAEATVKAVTLVLREQVQQRTTEQIMYKSERMLREGCFGRRCEWQWLFVTQAWPRRLRHKADPKYKKSKNKQQTTGQ